MRGRKRVKKLQKEIAAYEKIEPELRKTQTGKYALVKGDELVGTFDSFDAAASEGLQRFGDEDFLIRQIGVPLSSLSPAILYGLRGYAASKSRD